MSVQSLWPLIPAHQDYRLYGGCSTCLSIWAFLFCLYLILVLLCACFCCWFCIRVVSFKYPKTYSRVIEWCFLKCSFLHYIVILVETNDRCSGNYIGCCQLNYKFGNTITCNPSLEYIIFKLLLVKCIGVQMRKKKYTY